MQLNRMKIPNIPIAKAAFGEREKKKKNDKKRQLAHNC